MHSQLTHDQDTNTVNMVGRIAILKKKIAKMMAKMKTTKWRMKPYVGGMTSIMKTVHPTKTYALRVESHSFGGGHNNDKEKRKMCHDLSDLTIKYE